MDAEEVRALAQRTQASTEDIANIVATLQSSAGNTFSSIDESAPNADMAIESPKEIMQALQTSLYDIVHDSWQFPSCFSGCRRAALKLTAISRASAPKPQRAVKRSKR